MYIERYLLGVVIAMVDQDMAGRRTMYCHLSVYTLIWHQCNALVLNMVRGSWTRGETPLVKGSISFLEGLFHPRSWSRGR